MALAWRATVASGNSLVASTPAAAPAVVASCMVGNALFVPVDKAISGASSQPLANARLVPSPPRTTTAAAPCKRACRADRVADVRIDLDVECVGVHPEFVHGAPRNVVRIRHVPDRCRRKGANADQAASHHRRLLLVVEHRRAGSHAPDILAGCRVGDQADDAQMRARFSSLLSHAATSPRMRQHSRSNRRWAIRIYMPSNCRASAAILSAFGR